MLPPSWRIYVFRAFFTFECALILSLYFFSVVKQSHLLRTFWVFNHSSGSINFLLQLFKYIWVINWNYGTRQCLFHPFFFSRLGSWGRQLWFLVDEQVALLVLLVVRYQASVCDYHVQVRSSGLWFLLAYAALDYLDWLWRSLFAFFFLNFHQRHRFLFLSSFYLHLLARKDSGFYANHIG